MDFEQSSIRVYEGFSANKLGKTKSRKSRVVPMVDEIAQALRDLNGRIQHTGKKDLVFVSRGGTHLDGSALRRRYLDTVEAAGLRRLQPRSSSYFWLVEHQCREHRAGSGVDGPR